MHPSLCIGASLSVCLSVCETMVCAGPKPLPVFTHTFSVDLGLTFCGDLVDLSVGSFSLTLFVSPACLVRHMNQSDEFFLLMLKALTSKKVPSS